MRTRGAARRGQELPAELREPVWVEDWTSELQRLEYLADPFYLVYLAMVGRGAAVAEWRAATGGAPEPGEAAVVPQWRDTNPATWARAPIFDRQTEVRLAQLRALRQARDIAAVLRDVGADETLAPPLADAGDDDTRADLLRAVRASVAARQGGDGRSPRP